MLVKRYLKQKGTKDTVLAIVNIPELFGPASIQCFIVNGKIESPNNYSILRRIEKKELYRVTNMKVTDTNKLSEEDISLLKIKDKLIR